MIKKHYKSSDGLRFSVMSIDGMPPHEIKLHTWALPKDLQKRIDVLHNIQMQIEDELQAASLFPSGYNINLIVHELAPVELHAVPYYHTMLTIRGLP